jgi:hypothetical protein
MHPILSIITAFFFLAITKNKDASSNYPARIETLSVASPAFIFISARAVDRFSAVLSASARFLIWRNIYYSNS